MLIIFKTSLLRPIKDLINFPQCLERDHGNLLLVKGSHYKTLNIKLKCKKQIMLCPIEFEQEVLKQGR